MVTSVQIAITASRFLRSTIRELFREAAGVQIDETSFNSITDYALIDELDSDDAIWHWMNKVLMLMRTIHGILEDGEAINILEDMANQE